MPKHAGGVTAVLDPKARAMCAREALALACELEDLADSLARLPGARKVAARLGVAPEAEEDLDAELRERLPGGPGPD